MQARVKSLMAANFCSGLEKTLVLAWMEEKVELIVAVAARTVPDCILAVSNASSIHPSISLAVSGTHKVFPRLAMI